MEAAFSGKSTGLTTMGGVGKSPEKLVRGGTANGGKVEKKNPNS